MSTMQFQMLGAREILPLFAGPNIIERHISALEESIESNPSLAFDLSRSLIECVCKTILTDCGESPESLGFKDLLKRTYSACQLVPDSHTAKPGVIACFQNIIEGFEIVIQSLTNLRNSEGIASHGKDAFVVQLETAQAMLAAQSADTIIRYLYTAHKNYQLPTQVRQLLYNDNPEFNEYIDDNNEPFQIFELTYQPSELLFNVDQDAYRSYLAQFTPANQVE